MKTVYCSNCGTRLSIIRKALPKYARIIDLVEHHICPDEPVELDLTPEQSTPYTEKEGGKFSQKLTQLSHQTGTGDLRDRRDVDDVKKELSSTAPMSLLRQVGRITNTSPAHNPDKEPEDV